MESKKPFEFLVRSTPVAKVDAHRPEDAAACYLELQVYSEYKFVISDIRDFHDRRAPYAPISSLERFFERIRDRSVPEHIDHAFLRKLGVASNNEYALLSALKFLEIVDPRGRPTKAYRDLQSAEAFQPALRRLVHQAYAQAFEVGVESRPLDELVEFFRRTSSPSQAKNAARFFQAVCRRAGIDLESDKRPVWATAPVADHAADQLHTRGVESSPVATVPPALTSSSSEDIGLSLLRTKAELLEKLPAIRPEWSAAEYRSICDRFVEMLRHLDETNVP